MRDEHVFDLLPGYALGILDEDDLLKVAAHLTMCASCREELETYQATVDQMAQAETPQAPSPALKAKVLDRVALGGTTAVRPTAARELPRAGFLASLRSVLAGNMGLALGALALLLVLFLGINNFLLWQRVNDLQARVPPNTIHIIQLKGTQAAPQATGYIMVFPHETYGALAVEDAPVLDKDHQYQIWLIQDGKRTSGGVFSVNSEGYGTLGITANRPLDNFQSFGITIEPAGGSPGPTGKKVLGGSL